MSDKPKAIFIHCQTVYDTMREQAKLEVIGDETLLVYTGYLSKMFADELNLPNAYYSYVMSELKNMDCVRLLQRGGGTAKAKWVLLKEPDAGEFEITPKKKSRHKKIDILEQEVKNLRERVDSIDKQLKKG